MARTATEGAVSPRIDVEDMSPKQLRRLNREAGWSFERRDLPVIQQYFEETGRPPTRLELEVLAQTWSEHCQHRVFHARIEHTTEQGTEIIDGIFDRFVREVTESARDQNPGFVVSAFEDNAGFIRLDEDLAACLKVETHNHPSAIDPYAGASTGVGGVIRDVLGAGKGARPIASLDVFCVGDPTTAGSRLPDGVIHPRKVLQGMASGVRDYGNRMGIPTVAGALCFHSRYTYNPLVFCGTAGVIPVKDVGKSIQPGQSILVAGGRTGRDGLHGATFSSASLSGDSHEEDQESVQIGHPIEEKTLTDFVLEARRQDLISFITDCGAGGFSSAVGEMVQETGGVVRLEEVPLKEEGLSPWEVFLSESQERMVLAAPRKNVDELVSLARDHGTECTEIGRVKSHGRLRVKQGGETVCDLECDFLHEPPRRRLTSRYCSTETEPKPRSRDRGSMKQRLLEVLGSREVASREPIVRQYDFEVQGNTLLKPLTGAEGDAPQDGVGVRVGDKALVLGVSILPRQGLRDPRRGGLSTLDEAVRQTVVAGADPRRIGLLDNFCMGDPENPDRLGELVEFARGMAEAARGFGLPFISGKDSFYNCYRLDEGRIQSIPMSLLISALGVVEDTAHLTGSTLRRTDSDLYLLGETLPELGGSVYNRCRGWYGFEPPDLDVERAQKTYGRFHKCVRNGWVRSAHDCSEGGLGAAICEMGFSLRAGIQLDLGALPGPGGLEDHERLFSESNARVLFEAVPGSEQQLREQMEGIPFARVGSTTNDHRDLHITRGDRTVVRAPLEELKTPWKNGLEHCF